jgi:TIR domain
MERNTRMTAGPVFISYSHDSTEHSARVRELADALIEMGLDVQLDQFVRRPARGWPHWCEERLRPENAAFVLVICTANYRKRVEDRVSFDEGRGAFWEGALIHQYIYEEKGNTRFIPVLLGDTPDDAVPFPLRPFTRYRLKAFDVSDPLFQELYCELIGHAPRAKPVRGAKAIVQAGEIPAPIMTRPANGRGS